MMNLKAVLALFAVLMVASFPALAAYVPPTEATTAVTDTSEAITYYIGVAFTLAAITTVGFIGVKLFKRGAWSGVK